MMLRTRVAVTSLLVAIPATAVMAIAIERVRARDLERAAARVALSQINDQVRERCESDPGWFLTGPLLGRPPGGVFVERSPDDLPPRPRVEPQPFELFAYDEAFVGSSSGSARFPQDFRRAMRTSSQPASAPYETENGTGVQVAVPTGWTGGPCMYFLARMEPPPNQLRQRVLTVAGLFVVSLAVALLATTPTVGRVRRLARDARASVDGNFTAIAPDRHHDELSSLTFVLNDSSQVLHERRARIDDLDEALRRFVKTTEDEVAKPLAALERRLAENAGASSPTRQELQDTLRQAHVLRGEIENLVAATRLRTLPPTPETAPVNLTSILARIVERQAPLALAGQVSVRLSTPESPVVIQADEALIERAVDNIIDNAVRYNRPGGEVTVSLKVDAAERRFRLWVADNGPGVTEEQFRGLTAIRRFRGDEGRNRRPGAPGLGLAVAREVCDRYGLQLDLKRPGAGGFEVEFSGPV